MPQPGRAMTPAEWDALGETEVTYELVSGVLVVPPRAVRRHQLAMVRLAAQLDAQVPSGWEAVGEIDVLVHAAEPVTVRVAEPFPLRIDIDALGGARRR